MKIPRILALVAFIGLLSYSCKKNDVVQQVSPPQNNNNNNVNNNVNADNGPLYITAPSYITQAPVMPYQYLNKQVVSLGRMLFYDPSLSSAGKVACASCHNIGTAFADQGKTLSQGQNGLTVRNTPPLFNMAWHPNTYSWIGNNDPTSGPISYTNDRMKTQILKAITSNIEMDSKVDDLLSKISQNPGYSAQFQAAFGANSITQDHMLDAIAEFVRSITSFGSKYDMVRSGVDRFSDAEERGYELFKGQLAFQKQGNGSWQRLTGTTFGLGCTDCHKEPFFQNDGIALQSDGYNSSIVPTLRNIFMTAPYMDNGGLGDIDAVLSHYSTTKINAAARDINLLRNNNSGGGYFEDKNPKNTDTSTVPFEPGTINMTSQEQSDLKAFLSTLNDPTLAKNPAYAKP
jgi:cytochrome c peroxidase